MELAFGEHDTGEVRLHYAKMGPKDAPLILCLHGFPEYWTAWKTVMGRAGRRFSARRPPDQRGFNLSSRPPEVEAYRGRHLVADIASLADHLSAERPFVLAGHDWGRFRRLCLCLPACDAAFPSRHRQWRAPGLLPAPRSLRIRAAPGEPVHAAVAHRARRAAVGGGNNYRRLMG